MDTMATQASHFLRGVLECPDCGNDELEAVSDGCDTNFLCHKCWSCWHWDLGYMMRVTPATCLGCHHKDECFRRSAARQAAATEPRRPSRAPS